MKLEDIGFYTLTDKRAENTSWQSFLWRCELILTDRCNFKCPYCRGVNNKYKGVLDFKKATEIIDLWSKEGLKNIRFSGGEPLTYLDINNKNIFNIVEHTKEVGIKRIAISTNGSFDYNDYKRLFDLGVNDFSISLDPCCSVDSKMMTGTNINYFKRISNNIARLSELTYITMGIVLTNNNIEEVNKIIEYGYNLGVHDIRIISAAQKNRIINVSVDDKILEKFKILKYRVNNFGNGNHVRGIKKNDCHKCYLLLDDMAIAQNYHFPCIIYFRENGEPIGKVGKNMRKERYEWFKNNNTFKNDICRNNCLDVCVDYNNKAKQLKGEKSESNQ